MKSSAGGRDAASLRHAEARRAPAILEVERFSKSYGSKRVAEDISLTVRPRSIHGFIGANGAGKTTLIRSIVGAQTFDGGDIRICGMSVRTHPVECKSLTAYVPDNPEAYGFLTGAQYLAYQADLFEVPGEARRTRIARLAETFQIGDRLGEPVSAYSHGMRQKLVLTGAFLHEPKLLVLDEPFVGLDPQASHNLKSLMKDLVARGSAIFFSSHVLEVVEKLADETSVIRAGRIVRSGPTADVRGDATLEDAFLELDRSENPPERDRSATCSGSPSAAKRQGAESAERRRRRG